MTDALTGPPAPAEEVESEGADGPRAAALGSERPFPGLRPFDYGDASYFFGREDQTFALYRLLDASRFVAVVGSSGSGKSSLVRAGLHPLLDEESRGRGGRSWVWAEMRPGSAPIENLADVLVRTALVRGGEDAGLAPVRRGRILSALRESSLGLTEALGDVDGLSGRTLVLVVDQFEELFRYSPAGLEPAERVGANLLWREETTQFVQLLQEASRDRERRVHVLITLRSDFIGECAQFHGLPELVSACQYLVPSLTRDQREEVIRRPIEAAGGSIDPELVQRLLNDGAEEIDQLPVLQHCLMRLWSRALQDRAPDGPVSVHAAHYEAIGGLAGALSRHADEVMESLPGQALEIELTFRTLSEVDSEGRAVRRPLMFAQLADETGAAEPDLAAIVNRFRADDCSFLAPPASAVPVLEARTVVDVGHEALLRRWTKIGGGAVGSQTSAGWIFAEAEDARTFRGLLALAETGDRARLDNIEVVWTWWSKAGRTRAWANRYGGGYDRVRRLLENSLADSEAERRKHAAAQKRARTALMTVAGVGFGAAAVMAGLYIFASLAQWRAEVDRSALINQLQRSAVFNLTDELRLIPGVRLPLKQLLAEYNDFRIDDPSSIIAQRLLAAGPIAQGELDLVLGNTEGAKDAYDRLLAGLLKPSSVKGICSLELLRAQALIDDAKAQSQSGAYVPARQDSVLAYEMAESASRDAAIAHAQWWRKFAPWWNEAAVDCATLRRGEPDRYWALALSSLIQSEVAQPRRMGAAARVAMQALSDLIQAQPRRTDAQNRFWTLQRAGLYGQGGDLALAVAAGNLKDRSDYARAMNSYQMAAATTASMVADETTSLDAGYSTSIIAFHYYKYHLDSVDLTLNSHDENAKTSLQNAYKYFNKMVNADIDAVYWWNNCAEIQAALGDQAMSVHDISAAISSYSLAVSYAARAVNPQPNTLANPHAQKLWSEYEDKLEAAERAAGREADAGVASVNSKAPKDKADALKSRRVS